MTSWNKLLAEFDDYINYNTLSPEQLAREFDDKMINGLVKFHAWSTQYVYFDVVIDGMIFVRRAPRSPHAHCNQDTPRKGQHE